MKIKFISKNFEEVANTWLLIGIIAFITSALIIFFNYHGFGKIGVALFIAGFIGSGLSTVGIFISSIQWMDKEDRRFLLGIIIVVIICSVIANI